MKQDFSDFMHDQIIAISKAGAYDAIQPEYMRLIEENATLKKRVEYLEGLISEYVGKMTANLSGPKVDQFLKDQLNDNDDLKDINI